MINSIKDKIELSNGVKIPWLGFGTYKIKDPQEAIKSVLTAIKTGYRSIDTAEFYENEEYVGQGIKDSGIKREEIFITTKLWNNHHGHDQCLKAFNTSIKKLGLDYVDLYLIHWPVKGKIKETWKAFEKLYKDGKIRAIGVSNFLIHHLKEISESAEIQPMLNQVEFHPFLYQKELHEYCKKNNIQLEAWSPLVRARFFDNKILQELSIKYKKSPAQILLRWDLDKEIVTIPKSTHKKRIIENADIFDFILEKEDILKLDNLNRNFRTGPDPDNVNF